MQRCVRAEPKIIFSWVLRTWRSVGRIVKVNKAAYVRAVGSTLTDMIATWCGWGEEFRRERGKEKLLLLCTSRWGKISREKQTAIHDSSEFFLLCDVYNKKLTNLYWKLVTLETRDWWVASEKQRSGVARRLRLKEENINFGFAQCDRNEFVNNPDWYLIWAEKQSGKWFFRVLWEENFPH